eukprot:scaffold116225_cov19-Tisochrysis_lutea.AAC.3
MLELLGEGTGQLDATNYTSKLPLTHNYTSIYEHWSRRMIFPNIIFPSTMFQRLSDASAPTSGWQ